MRILRVVGSRDLSCGCCVGLYELFNGATVQIVDWHADSCQYASHGVGALVFGPSDGAGRGFMVTPVDDADRARRPSL